MPKPQKPKVRAILIIGGKKCELVNGEKERETRNAKIKRIWEGKQKN